MRKTQVNVAGVSISVPDNLLTLKDNGDYEKHYKADMSLDTVAIQADTDAEAAKIAKESRDKSLDDLVITHNTVAYDANGKSIGNMSAVMGVANFKYNQAVANGTSPAIAYQLIYKDTKIFWKGFDDKPHEVQIESVCEVLEKSMLEVASIIGV